MNIPYKLYLDHHDLQASKKKLSLYIFYRLYIFIENKLNVKTFRDEIN